MSRVAWLLAAALCAAPGLDAEETELSANPPYRRDQ